MSFSGALRAADVNDFITPSQSCVKPMFKEYSNSGQAKRTGVIQLHTDGNEGADLVAAPVVASAKIKLTDCLACSGCVTTAESVLISEQSAGEFIDAVGKGWKAIVVSISPQARASLAVSAGLSLSQMQKRLQTLFASHYRASLITDTSFATDIHIRELRKEFSARWASGGVFPLLTSACPGWVCYAEKSVGGYVLPYISACKSPQHIMGSLVKRSWARSQNLSPGDVYHAAIMPCFDKKLEASREDFQMPEGTREVDIVISTREIEELLKDKNQSFSSLEESSAVYSFTNVDPVSGEMFGVEGGSGGSLEYVLQHAVNTLFAGKGERREKQGRNQNIKEVFWFVDDVPVLRFAMAYGFRNLQTLMKKIKSGECSYHFVEIMACPSGCVNGGAQLRSGSRQGDRQLLRDVEAAYHSRTVRDPAENRGVDKVYAEFLDPTNPSPSHPHPDLTTEYHEREQMGDPLRIQW